MPRGWCNRQHQQHLHPPWEAWCNPRGLNQPGQLQLCSCWSSDVAFPPPAPVEPLVTAKWDMARQHHRTQSAPALITVISLLVLTPFTSILTANAKSNPQGELEPGLVLVNVLSQLYGHSSWSSSGHNSMHAFLDIMLLCHHHMPFWLGTGWKSCAWLRCAQAVEDSSLQGFGVHAGLATIGFRLAGPFPRCPRAHH